MSVALQSAPKPGQAWPCSFAKRAGGVRITRGSRGSSVHSGASTARSQANVSKRSSAISRPCFQPGQHVAQEIEPRCVAHRELGTAFTAEPVNGVDADVQRFGEPAAVEQGRGLALLENRCERFDYGVCDALTKLGDEPGEGGVERSGGSGRPSASAAAATLALE